MKINNRMKNSCILAILLIFLLIIDLIPVTCFFKQVTGISCPSCGMTRAFHSIISFDLISAIKYNILSIPLFIFIMISISIFVYEIITNQFQYIPKLLKVLSKRPIIFFILFFFAISFLINNITT